MALRRGGMADAPSPIFPLPSLALPSLALLRLGTPSRAGSCLELASNASLYRNELMSRDREQKSHRNAVIRENMAIAGSKSCLKFDLYIKHRLLIEGEVWTIEAALDFEEKVTREAEDKGLTCQCSTDNVGYERSST